MATFCRALAPANRPPSTYSAATGGRPSAGRIARAPEVATSPICVSNSSRRRSMRSAMAPPRSDIETSGTSSAAPSSPTINADPVSR